MKATLIFCGPAFYGGKVIEKDSEVTLGRSEDRDISISGPEDVSRYHCNLYSTNSGVCIKDYSSRGTFVNGSRINPDEYVILHNGDELTFGRNLKAILFIENSGLLRGLRKRLKRVRSA